MSTHEKRLHAGAAAGAGGTDATSGRRDLIALLIGFAALAAWDYTPLDRSISQLFGTAAGFAWRENWWTADLLHDKARALSWIVAFALIWNVWRPLWFAHGLSRVERVLWLVMTLACLLLVPILKQISATSCPWSLAEFGGGTARYVSHWAFGQRDGGPGRCFPAGHAVAAFGFLPGYFALRNTAPRAARWWLALTLAAGLVFTGVQVVRGAHFVSHGLWTAWWCWALCLACLHGSALLRARRSVEVGAV